MFFWMFRYWFPGETSNTLGVHVLRSGELSAALWHRSGAPSSGWEVAEVTVSSPGEFHVSCFVFFHCFEQRSPLSPTQSNKFLFLTVSHYFCEAAF